jgi:hypothetical protein
MLPDGRDWTPLAEHACARVQQRRLQIHYSQGAEADHAKAV